MSAPLRIGYVVKRFPRVSETFIAQEVLALERLGAQVEVFALGPNDAPAEHGWLDRLRAPVNVMAQSFADAWTELAVRYREPASRRSAARTVLAALEDPMQRGRRALGHAVEIARRVETGRIDHLHAHFANQPAMTAWLVHRFCGTSFSFTAHAKDIWVNPAGRSRWRRLVGAASFVVAVSDATRDHLIHRIGEDLSDRIRRLYNGVDLDAITPVGNAAAADGVLRLLCVARLIEKKGVDTLLDACALLQRQGASFQVSIIGDGPLGGVLRERANRAGLDGKVSFLGAEAHECVIAAMQASHGLVLPCRVAADGDMDALPTVLLEAMACGLPCVSTPIAGVGEIIDDGVTGRLVEPDDPAGLAAAITASLGDPVSRARMGRAGRARAEALFDVDRNARVLHEWMRGAAEVNSRGGAEALRCSA